MNKSLSIPCLKMTILGQNSWSDLKILHNVFEFGLTAKFHTVSSLKGDQEIEHSVCSKRVHSLIPHSQNPMGQLSDMTGNKSGAADGFTYSLRHWSNDPKLGIVIKNFYKQKNSDPEIKTGTSWSAIVYANR